jgi:hypothetical protein
MNDEDKIGLGLVAGFALCCGAPLIIGFLVSGTVAGALSAMLGGGRPLLVGVAVLLIALGIWLMARRTFIRTGALTSPSHDARSSRGPRP